MDQRDFLTYRPTVGSLPGTAFSDCGEEAADAFCRLMGWDAATLWSPDVQVNEPTIHLFNVRFRACVYRMYAWDL